MSKLKVALLLKDSHPLSAREIAEALGMSASYGRACVSYCKKHRLIHVTTYRRDEDGGRLYPRALYAYGPGNGAKKLPPLTDAEYRKRHKQKKLMLGANSVFAMGIPVDKRRLTSRKRPDIAKKSDECVGTSG